MTSQHLPPPLPTRYTNSRRDWFTPRNAVIAIACLIVVLYIVSRPFMALRGQPRVEFSDIRITKDFNSITNEPYAYRVSGRVHNLGRSVLILPVFHVSLDAPAARRHHCATGILVPPGDWAYFVTGGVHDQPAVLSRTNRPVVSLDYSDAYTDADYVSHQIRHRRQLHVDGLHFDLATSKVSGRLRNESGLHVTAIQGTAVFFDREGALSECDPFAVTFKSSDFSFYPDLENRPKAVTCKLQIDTFTDSSHQTPDSVPVPPSV